MLTLSIRFTSSFTGVAKIVSIPLKLFKITLLQLILLNLNGFVEHFKRQPTKWSNRLKQFPGFCRRIVWVCLTISGGWRLKGWKEPEHSAFHCRDFYCLHFDVESLFNVLIFTQKIYLKEQWKCNESESKNNVLRKICQNAGFLWPVYSGIKTEP